MNIVTDIRAEASKVQRMNAKAKKLGAALFTMAGIYQVEPIRAMVMPQLIRHPHISSLAGGIFGFWLLLHNPEVQDAGMRVVRIMREPGTSHDENSHTISIPDDKDSRS